MTEKIMISLAQSLGLTLAIESGFFLLIGKRDKKDLLLLVFVNLLTNPIVVLSVLLVLYYTSWNVWFVLIPLEVFAVLVEGYYYKKYGRDFRRPYLFSLAANLVSFGSGQLIQLLL